MSVVLELNALPSLADDENTQAWLAGEGATLKESVRHAMDELKQSATSQALSTLMRSIARCNKIACGIPIGSWRQGLEKASFEKLLSRAKTNLLKNEEHKKEIKLALHQLTQELLRSSDTRITPPCAEGGRQGPDQ